MFAYRFGRLLQILALIDCGFALFFSDLIPKLGGMDPQFQIIIFAGVLFAAGRFLQKKGEASLRASGLMPPISDAGESSSPSADGRSGNR